MSKPAILNDLTSTPKAGKAWTYRWCDFLEVRCLVHPDGRFSRDNFAEALGESVEMAVDTAYGSDDVDDEGLIPLSPMADDDAPEIADDQREAFSTRCFRQLRWRATTFGADWPFEIDPAGIELQLRKTPRNAQHWLYLQLLLSASLSYCPPKRRADLTSPFETLSFNVLKRLMPAGAEVHSFGAGKATRYTGHLYDRLVGLAKDLRGRLLLEREHFATQDAGDGGLDLVAWHGLGDGRDHIMAALAQCGCTTDGWPDKMQEASPSRLGGHLAIASAWTTYYFMPLDLADEINGHMDWQRKSDMGTAIVIDRLRFLRLADADELLSKGLLETALVQEATALKVA